jgi:hypothetical protein
MTLKTTFKKKKKIENRKQNERPQGNNQAQS